MIKDEEDYKAVLARRIREKSGESPKKQDAKIIGANENSKRYLEELMNMESFEPLSMYFI
jgi:rRNA processing protein Krr1/Pno1